MRPTVLWAARTNDAVGDSVARHPAAHIILDVGHTVGEGNRPPPLHRAFSVFLFDPATERLLLQRRAASKRTFPGLWSNTCCSHPLQGETIHQAMRRKLQDELGIPPMMVRMATRRELGMALCQGIDWRGGGGVCILGQDALPRLFRRSGLGRARKLIRCAPIPHVRAN